MTKTDTSERELRDLRRQILEQFERINAIRTEKLTVLGLARDAALAGQRMPQDDDLLSVIENTADESIAQAQSDDEEGVFCCEAAARPAADAENLGAPQFSVDFVLLS